MLDCLRRNLCCCCYPSSDVYRVKEPVVLAPKGRISREGNVHFLTHETSFVTRRADFSVATDMIGKPCFSDAPLVVIVFDKCLDILAATKRTVEDLNYTPTGLIGKKVSILIQADVTSSFFTENTPALTEKVRTFFPPRKTTIQSNGAQMPLWSSSAFLYTYAFGSYKIAIFQKEIDQEASNAQTEFYRFHNLLFPKPFQEIGRLQSLHYFQPEYSLGGDFRAEVTSMSGKAGQGTMVLIHKMDGTILAANNKLLTTTGYQRDTLLLKPLDYLLGPSFIHRNITSDAAKTRIQAQKKSMTPHRATLFTRGWDAATGSQNSVEVTIAVYQPSGGDYSILSICALPSLTLSSPTTLPSLSLLPSEEPLPSACSSARSLDSISEIDESKDDEKRES